MAGTDTSVFITLDSSGLLSPDRKVLTAQRQAAGIVGGNLVAAPTIHETGIATISAVDGAFTNKLVRTSLPAPIMVNHERGTGRYPSTIQWRKAMAKLVIASRSST